MIRLDRAMLTLVWAVSGLGDQLSTCFVHKTPVCGRERERKARYRSTEVIAIYNILRSVTTSKIV